VPAVFAATARRSDVRRWNAADAQRWLGFLARHLHRSDSPDLAWWRLSGAVPAVVFGAFFGSACGLITYGLAAFYAAFIDPTTDPLKEGVAAFVAVFAAASLVTTAVRWRAETAYTGALNFVCRFTLGFAIALPFGPPFYLITGLAAGLSYSTQPSRVRVRFRGAGRKFALRAAVGFALGAGAVGLTGFGAGSVLPLALGGGVVIGLASGLMVWFSPPASVEQITDPKGALRQDRAATLIYAPVFGLICGLLTALQVTIGALGLTRLLLGGALTRVPAVVVAVGLAALGVAFGVILICLITICSTWGIFLISRACLAVSGRCPWRLMRFLADSRSLGVLRQVGGVYQFRHNQLQDRLAAEARPGRYRSARTASQLSKPGRGHWRRFAATARSPARIGAAVGIVAALAITDRYYPQVLSRPLPLALRSGSGYVSVQWPSLKAYSPALHEDPYQFDSATAGGVLAAGSILIFRIGTGYHRILFARLGTAYGMAQVNAYGDKPAICGTANWIGAPGSTEIVDVACYTRAGRLVDVPFGVSFTDRSAGGRFSYLLADGTRHARPQQRVLWACDSAGGKAWVRRTSTGRYLVYIPVSAGLPAGAYFYQVTAYDAPFYCKLSAIPASSGIQQVTCRDTAGDFADSVFSVTFSAGTSFIGRTDRNYGYVSSADTDSVRLISPGYYEASVRGTGPLRRPATGLPYGGEAVAYAVGKSDAYCHIVGWAISDSGNTMTTWVRCWCVSTGQPVETRFSVGATW